MSTRKRIVILGGGFAGLYAALYLDPAVRRPTTRSLGRLEGVSFRLEGGQAAPRSRAKVA
jgi:glycine/D-amino acid oxidase-like deaminating enzyme